MRTNLAIAALIYPMVQAVLFGVGLVLLLVLQLTDYPVATVSMIGVSFLISVPSAVLLAPKLRSARWRRAHPHRRP